MQEAETGRKTNGTAMNVVAVQTSSNPIKSAVAGEVLQSDPKLRQKDQVFIPLHLGGGVTLGKTASSG